MDPRDVKIIKAAAVLGAAAANAVRMTVRAAALKPAPAPVEPLPEEKVDVDKYIKDLSDAVKIKTISNFDKSLIDYAPFEEFRAFLDERFPLIAKELRKEVLADGALLYTWKGEDPTLDAVALLAHQDVVPVQEGTEKDWTYPAFDGVVADGFIWGRGTLDIKNHLICVMEAVETLLSEGCKPHRTVYLAFGHNEEVAATDENNGASIIMRELQSRGVRLDSVIDEGGAILPVDVKGVVHKNIAGIGIAEKGQVDVKVSVPGPGGHSSEPPVHSAIGRLAKVIQNIEDHQFKAEMTPLMDDLIDRFRRNAEFPVRLVLQDYRLIRPLILRAMRSIRPSACMVRTTTAVTQCWGSPAPNVLPQIASINVNSRIMPGQTMDDVVEHFRRVCGDKEATFEIIKGLNPSKISPTDSRAFRNIEKICRSMNSDNVVVPYLVMGGTDARRYEPICDNIYRYSPFLVDMSLLSTTHGTNERIPLSSLEDGLRFFKYYIKANAGE